MKHPVSSADSRFSVQRVVKRAAAGIGFGIFLLIAACQNPFAPMYDYSENTNNGGLSDLTQPEGVFTNLQYAYSFKDTLVYGQLIAEDFLFTYRDYDAGYDVSWGRESEMKTTHGLFTNTERLDLVWNNILVSTIDSVEATIVRGFNLTITFNPSDIIRIDGRVSLELRKHPQKKTWQIVSWVDESNFK